MTQQPRPDSAAASPPGSAKSAALGPGPSTPYLVYRSTGAGTLEQRGQSGGLGAGGAVDEEEDEP